MKKLEINEFQAFFTVGDNRKFEIESSLDEINFTGNTDVNKKEVVLKEKD